jgi:hypothetical protein
MLDYPDIKRHSRESDVGRCSRPYRNNSAIAGAELVFWNPRKSFFDVLPTTGPGYFSAG